MRHKFTALLLHGLLTSALGAEVAWPEHLASLPLAFDVGMNDHTDTLNLLSTGHRVVAVEANPRLSAVAETRLKRFVDAGLLRLETALLSADADTGTRPFYISTLHSEWSSLSAPMAW